MFENYDEILTVQDVMEILFIGKNAAYELLNTGQLKGFRLGRSWRIPREQLAQFIVDRYKTT